MKKKKARFKLSQSKSTTTEQKKTSPPEQQTVTKTEDYDHRNRVWPFQFRRFFFATGN